MSDQSIDNNLID